MSDIIVGRYRGRYLTARHQQFVLLAAPTGAEKGVGLILPNLLNYPDSVVVFDLKLENFHYTSRFRQRHGHEVYLWAPFAEDGRTHRWNMLDTVDRHSAFRVGDVLAIAQAFYPSDCHPKDKYWNDNARNLFLGLVLYLMETPELPCTLGEVFRQSSGNGQPVRQYLERILDQRRDGGRALSRECVDAFNRFLSASAESVGNIISTFNAPLLIFANPIVDAATSASDFAVQDVRRRRMSIYVGIPPHRLGDAGILVNIFFSQLIDLNTKVLPELDPSLRYECTLVLDELAAPGKIAALTKSNFYIRGYGLRLLSSLQSVAQLVARYGESEARTLIADHTVQIAYPPADVAEAEEYSKMLGYATQTAVSTSNSRSAGAADSRSESTSDHQRALMLPQELRIMPRHQQIVFPRNCRPILCDKARFYEDHRFVDRLKAVSPYLAGLDGRGWRRPFRDKDWAKARPTKAQFDHAAYVLRELSAEIPLIPLAPAGTPTAAPAAKAQARRAAEAPAPEQAQPVLPPFNDAEQPTLDEANAIVEAFFSQMPLFEAATEADPGTTTATPGGTDHAPSGQDTSGRDQVGHRRDPIDLSLLDD